MRKSKEGKSCLGMGVCEHPKRLRDWGKYKECRRDGEGRKETHIKRKVGPKPGATRKGGALGTVVKQDRVVPKCNPI